MDERVSKRVAVDLTAHAQIDGASMRVHVYDLSMDGCSVEADAADLPWPGELITLKFSADVEFQGTLAWVMSRNGGVRFSERLPGSLVRDLGFSDASGGRKGFQDQFGRSHSIPGQRFDVARDRSPGR